MIEAECVSFDTASIITNYSNPVYFMDVNANFNETFKDNPDNMIEIDSAPLCHSSTTSNLPHYQTHDTSTNSLHSGDSCSSCQRRTQKEEGEGSQELQLTPLSLNKYIPTTPGHAVSTKDVYIACSMSETSLSVFRKGSPEVEPVAVTPLQTLPSNSSPTAGDQCIGPSLSQMSLEGVESIELEEFEGQFESSSLPNDPDFEEETPNAAGSPEMSRRMPADDVIGSNPAQQQEHFVLDLDGYRYAEDGCNHFHTLGATEEHDSLSELYLGCEESHYGPDGECTNMLPQQLATMTMYQSPVLVRDSSQNHEAVLGPYTDEDLCSITEQCSYNIPSASSGQLSNDQGLSQLEPSVNSKCVLPVANELAFSTNNSNDSNYIQPTEFCLLPHTKALGMGLTSHGHNPSDYSPYSFESTVLFEAHLD